jgi:hypothetical protein
MPFSNWPEGEFQSQFWARHGDFREPRLHILDPQPTFTPTNFKVLCDNRRACAKARAQDDDQPNELGDPIGRALANSTTRQTQPATSVLPALLGFDHGLDRFFVIPATAGRKLRATRFRAERLQAAGQSSRRRGDAAEITLANCEKEHEPDCILELCKLSACNPGTRDGSATLADHNKNSKHGGTNGSLFSTS